MKKKKGFTLVELLAVIVILAIIALIAVPIILNIINQARRAAFLDSAYGVLNATEYYYTRKNMGLVYGESNVVPLKLENKARSNILKNTNEEVKVKKLTKSSENIEKISFPDEENVLRLKGKAPDSGTVYIKESGRIALSIWSDELNLCAVKYYESGVIELADSTLTKEECGEGSSVENNADSGMIWDGWITITLYYPENSTDREYRVGEAGEVREEDWKDYEGPITVPISDVENIYIKYKINGKVVIIPPVGSIYVDIEPNSYTIKEGSTVTAKINATKGSEVYYKIGSTWEKYTEGNIISVNNVGLIEAKAEMTEDVFLSDGSKAYTRKVTAYDSVYIRNYKESVGSSSIGITRDKETGKIIPSYYIEGPTITVNPNERTTNVTVKLSTKETARKMYIKVGNQSYKEYTGEIEVNKNTSIYAYYIRESDGAVSSTSYKRIKNIYNPTQSGSNCSRPYVDIETSPSLRYKYAESINVTLKTNGEKLYYSTNGVEYSEYKDKIEVTKNQRLYAKAVNECGTTIEYIDITNIGKNGEVIPPTRKTTLAVDIEAKPEPETSDEYVNSVTIKISYDSKATRRYYKIGEYGKLKEYDGEFTIEENETIYAYAISDTGYGETSKKIDNIGDNQTNKPKGIGEPIIRANPNNQTQTTETTITIEYSKKATSKKYRIGNGQLREYTGPFIVSENTTIYAVNSDYDGNSKSSTYIVDNIVEKEPIYLLNYGDYFILKLNYPAISKPSSREYRFLDNAWTKYKEDGILLVTRNTTLNTDRKIIIKDENGKSIEFKGDFYYIDCASSEILSHIYMRWDAGKPATPDIIVNPTEATKEAVITINYDNTSKVKQYKVVEPDGTTNDWKTYKSPIKITKKNTVIYARSQNESEVYSEIGLKKITNIDEESPIIKLTADLETKTRELKLKVSVTDDVKVDTVMYAKGLQGTNYFKTGGMLIRNNSIVKITENGIYTFYAEDGVGNKQVYTIEVGNIDNIAPSIIIKEEPNDKVGTEVKISIEYGDSVTKKYKIGKNTTTWTNYTESFTLSSDTVVSKEYGNSDGSVTICAQGIDDVENKEEICENILTLDIDMPNVPVINSNYGYPILTEHGVKVDGETTISYDSRNDIDNYYSLDGNTWIKYTGSFTANSGTIYAKSVKKDTGLTSQTSKTLAMPSDALGINAYDNDESTAENPSLGKINIDPNMIGKKVKISIRVYDSKKPVVINAIDNNGTAIETFKFNKGGKVEITIPEGTVALSYSYVYGNRIYEIGPGNDPQIIGQSVYPTLTEYGVNTDINVGINYFDTSIQRLYKIGEAGNWQNYQNKKIRLELEETIYAKGIDKYGKETPIISYTSVLATDALGTNAYDNDESTAENPTLGKINIDPNMIGKKVKISIRVYSSNKPVAINAIDNNGTAIETFKFNKGGKVEITIPEGTVALSYSYVYGNRIYEIGPGNDPQIIE